MHGGVLLFLREHLARLWEGARAIDLDVGVSKEELARMLYAVLDANGMADGAHVRLMVTRGLKATPYQSPAVNVGGATMVIAAEWKAPPAAPRPPLRLFTTHVRRGAPDVQDPYAPLPHTHGVAAAQVRPNRSRLDRLRRGWNSHSKLNCIAACIQAAKAGADEALMLDPHGAPPLRPSQRLMPLRCHPAVFTSGAARRLPGFVATCNSTNFMVVRGGEVWAPTTRYQMAGITRANVLRAAARDGIPVRECDFSLTQARARARAPRIHLARRCTLYWSFAEGRRTPASSPGRL